MTLTPDELRRLDHVARGLRHDDPWLAGQLTTARPGVRPRRVPVLRVIVAATILGGAGVVFVALGCAGGGIAPLLVGTGFVGLCLAAITWLTAAPRSRQSPARTARRAARAPSVWSRSRWRR